MGVEVEVEVEVERDEAGVLKVEDEIVAFFSFLTRLAWA